MNHRRWESLLTLSLAFSILIPILGQTRMGDLSNRFGDHLHHAWATDLFVHHGLDIYRRKFGELWPGSTFPQKEEAWGQMSRPYPPGVFVVFAPMTGLARLFPMSKSTFGAIEIVYLLVLTHLGFLSMCRLFDRVTPGSRLVVGALVWAVLLHLALQGFYDPLWIGSGIAAAAALHNGRPVSALRWFALAALLHFRAVTLAPIGLLALVRTLRGKPWRQWPWPTLAIVAIAMLIVIASFVLTYPGTASRRALHPPVAQMIRMGEFAMVVAVTLGGGLWALRLRDPVLAGVMVIVGGLCIVDLGVYRGYWHHASIATVGLVATLAHDDQRSGERRQLAVLWLIAIFPIVWLANPAALLIDLGMRIHF